jgi:uncharacterized protein (DUF3820 family)
MVCKDYKDMKLDDLSPMPFGKYGPKPKGEGRNMADVPARYLHYLWTSSGFDKKSDVGIYISENLSALKKDHPDGIWS